MSDASLLVVEDDYSLRLLYSKMLTLAGFKTIAYADNGVKAIELYNSLPNKPKVILLDQKIPLKTGVEITREIRKTDPDCKIIFISGDSSIKKEAMSAGATFFIEKPFSYQQLIQTVNCAAM